MHDEQLLRDTMISLVFHELRMPLTFILNYASILADRIEGSDQECIRSILRHTLRMREVLDDFTLLTEWSTSHVSNYLQSVDVHRVVQNSITRLTAMTKVKQQLIQIEPTSQPMEITINAWLLELLLVTLLSSAIKHTPAGGCVYVGFARKNDTALITIKCNSTDGPWPEKPDVVLCVARSLAEAVGGDLIGPETTGDAIYSLGIPTGFYVQDLTRHDPGMWITEGAHSVTVDSVTG